MRFGVRIGVDPGDARIGVARSDPSGMLATPVETVPRGRGDLRRLKRIVVDEEAVEVVVGLPRSLSGGEGPAAAKAREFAQRLAEKVAPVPVRLTDERLSTVTAETMLRDQRKGAKRRAVVDQVAAVVILQHALDTERATGRAPGEVVAVVADAVARTTPPSFSVVVVFDVTFCDCVDRSIAARSSASPHWAAARAPIGPTSPSATR